MLGGVRKRGRYPIGIDMGTHCIRMLQLANDGSQLKVQAAAKRVLVGATGPLNHEAYHEAAGAAIREMLRSAKFVGRDVVTSLPASVVQFKNLRLPKMPADELAGAVEWEAAERLHLDGQPVQIQFFNAGEVRQGDELRQEVILMAAPTPFIEDHVRVLLDLGLRPQAVDVIPAALSRCLCRHADTAELNPPAKVIVDVGYLSTKVAIVRGGRLVFFKLIDIGGHKLDQMLANQLHLPADEAAKLRRHLDEEPGEDAAGLFGTRRREDVERAIYEAVRPLVTDLAREVALCLRYYSVTFRGQRPSELHLLGGEAGQRWLADILAEGTGVKVRRAEPLSEFDTSQMPAAYDAQFGAWAVAAGLSLRRAGSQQAERRAA